MSKVYDVVAAHGEYTDSNGQTKVRWRNHGVVVKTEKGLSLKLESTPAGDWNGWFKLFEPKNPTQQAAQSAGQPDPYSGPRPGDFDDSIPF